MADTRLSDLASASALSASDLFYVVQTPGSGGEKATGTQLLALVGTAYVPLAGGTMTGALTLPAGAVGTPSLMFTGGGATTGIYSTGSNNISFGVNGTRIAYINHESLLVNGITFLTSSNAALRFGGGGVADVYLQRLGNYRLGMYDVLQVSPVSLEIYGKYTDASNYERLAISAQQGVGFTIGAETLGTGADNLDITIAPAGNGSLKLPGSTSIDASGYGILIGCRFSTSVGVNYYSTGVRMRSTAELAWTSGLVDVGVDLAFHRDSAGVAAIDNGTAATYRDLKLRNLLNVEYHQMTEMTAPSAPATNSVRIYAEDNGSGKTRLMALFATGVAQQLAIEP